MRRSTLCFGLLLGSLPFVAWGQSPDADGKASENFTRQDWAILHTLSPLPDLPVDTTDKYRDSPAAALLGQKLFFEPRLSGPIQTGTPQEGQFTFVMVCCDRCSEEGY